MNKAPPSTQQNKKDSISTQFFIFFSVVSLSTFTGSSQNFENPFLAAALLVTLRTLKRTVLLRGRHSPTVTTSPMLMSLKKGKGTQLIHYWYLKYLFDLYSLSLQKWCKLLLTAVSFTDGGKHTYGNLRHLKMHHDYLAHISTC